MPVATTNTPDFTTDERKRLAVFAREAVEASVLGNSEPHGSLKIASTPCSGVFVSLKRGNRLRACLGNLSENDVAPLGTMLEAAASRVTMLDTRFPRIHDRELPHLTVEVSVMHDVRVVDCAAENRASAIEIGVHGVIISYQKKRGLLLPQVAIEKGLTASGFLDQACKKAELPVEGWKRADVVLKTFQGSVFESLPAGESEFSPESLSGADRNALFEIIQSGFENRSRQFTVSSALVLPQPTPIGIYLECADGKNALALQQNVTLIDLVKQATRSLLSDNPTPAPLARVFVLSSSITLNSGDEPARFEAVQGWAALSRDQEQVSFVLNPDVNSIETSLIQIGVEPAKWSESSAEVTVFKTDEIERPTKQQGAFDEPTGLVRNTTSKEPGGKPIRQRSEDSAKTELEENLNKCSASDIAIGVVREPAVAGEFYPAAPDAIQTALDNYFFRVPADTSLDDCRAILLPHAGWEFSGDIIAETVSRAKIPERILIIGPKHTSTGANWSVSGSSEWKLPHAKIPVDVAGVKFLADRISNLEVDTEAHESEHGIEVLLPFLLWANPRMKVIPIVIGDAEMGDLGAISKALAEWRAEVIKTDGRAPLFVISSDLNHFADEAENRRRDELALGQLRAADPEGLFKTCTENDISMCGMRPAVAVLGALNFEEKCEVEVTKYDTSAKVSGDSSRVVGYAGALLK